jgi:hypothetical protein
MGVNALEVRGMGDQEDITDIERRKMVVMLIHEDEKVVAKFQKNNDTLGLNDYRRSIRELNDDFTMLVDSLGPLHNEFIYMIYDSLQEMEKEEKAEYAVIYFARYEIYIDGGETKTKTSYDINWNGNLIDRNSAGSNSRSKEDFYTVMKVSKLDEFRRTPPFQIPMPHIVPTKTDMAFGLSYASWYLKQRMKGNSDSELRKIINENTEDLSKITLLVNASDVKQQMVDDPYEGSYPFTFNVIPQEMYEQIILSQTPGYAYLVMNCGKACIVRTEDAEPMFIPRLYDWKAMTSFAKMCKDVEKIAGN